MSVGLTLQMLRRDVSNLSLLRRRGFDGHIVSMHQSGTHWLKYLLAMVICRGFDVPEPEHIGDNSVVGHPRSIPEHAGPIIVHSHSIPSPLVHATPFRQMISYPRYVVLVRDIRSALVSHYEKWKSRYDVSFSEYLRGDVAGRRFDKDIWWDIRFINAWSGVMGRLPDVTLLVHYETLKSETETGLQRICGFFRMPADSEIIKEAIAASSKERMSAKESPGEELPVVRAATSHPFEVYSLDDQRFLTGVLNEHLRNPLGYDYADWSRS